MPTLAELLELQNNPQAYVGYPQLQRQAARMRQAQAGREAENLPDPRTYGFIRGLLGANPDELGMSVLSPNTAKAKEAAYYGAQLSNLAQMLPAAKPLEAGAMAVGRAGERYAEKVVPQIMEKGGLGAQLLQDLAQGSTSPLTVWHGSPYKFNKFDAAKIGSGEGAQVYGHGIYVAENPEVAGQYAKTLEHKAFGKIIQNAPNNYDVFDNEGKKLASNVYYGKAKKLYDAYNTEQKGKVYKIDLPDEHIEKMLDWDKPLSKDAPQEVKDAFNNIIKEHPEFKDKFMQAFREGKPGSHYYSLLNDYAKTGDLVKNQAFAADVLQKSGIPGIKYLDQGSRGAGKGSRNFVIFPNNEHLLQIQDINGSPLK